MSDESVTDSKPGYWSIDIPGLTQSQAVEIASTLRGRWGGLNPILVDPAHFLTLHMDRESVDAIRAALSEASGDGQLIADGLRELIEEWLAATADSKSS